MTSRSSPALPSAALAVLLVALVTSNLSESVAAQCATQWLAGPGVAGTDAAVMRLTTLPNGDLVACGPFTTAGGVSASYIASWNGTSWSMLGPGVNDHVYAILTLPNGDLVVGGHFSTAGGVSASRIARWNGTSWSALGSGMNNDVWSLATMPNGDLVAGGQFTTAGGVSANHIARWNGTSWSALGVGLVPSSSSVVPIVTALVVLPNGDLVAGGTFTAAGGVSANCIARWNGTSWLPLGSGMLLAGPFGPSVRSLAVLPNGDLVAGGFFTTAGGVTANFIARWGGTSWSALGSGLNSPVTDFTTLPNGDLVAGGGFTTAGGVSVNCIARWNGTSWSALGSGVFLPPLGPGGPIPVVAALTALPNGDLVAGGLFATAGGVGANNLARLQFTTTCPATAVSHGAGCSGSGGPNVLAATSLPWIGSTFRSVATGMPAPALAVGVRGFSTTSIPMPSILPQGVPGCTLLVSPDLLELYVPAAGSVQTQFVIPNAIVLVGVVLHQQVVPIELSGTGSITALTGTNALTLTIGSF